MVQFLRKVEQTLKIRNYAANSRKSYLYQVSGFLRWHGNLPHTITRQDVCNYLELLVDGGASSSQLSGCLSAIRTCFDKFCGRDITLGLASPRKPKRQPIVPSTEEVTRIIDAAPTRIAKLAIGILYAAGLRNSELCRLQVRDIDFQRKTIRIYQGKGCSDRLVMLPETWHTTLVHMCHDLPGNAWLFPSRSNQRRYISSRTLQRWVSIAADFAGIKNRITPHSFRHAFATHLLESGTDIRSIQKLLGHQRLETTTIYTKVARIRQHTIQSPIDRLRNTNIPKPPHIQGNTQKDQKPPVGKLRIHLKYDKESNQAKVTLEVLDVQQRDLSASNAARLASRPERIFLTGITVGLTNQNWVQLTMPEDEQWAAPLAKLSTSMIDRINSPEFYETIRLQICKRFLAQC